jgi:hypothetical protein
MDRSEKRKAESTEMEFLRSAAERTFLVFNPSKTESESESLYEWRLTANQFVLAPGLMTTDFFFAT